MKVDNKIVLGQTLLEVVVALLVSTIIAISLIAVAVRSINNAKLSENKTLAAKYAQEAVEQVRIVRDTLGWEDFKEYETTYPKNCYEVNYEVSNKKWELVQIVCSVPSPISGTIFSRKIVLTKDGDLVRNVEVIVYWEDSGGSHQSVVNTKLSKWQ